MNLKFNHYKAFKNRVFIIVLLFFSLPSISQISPLDSAKLELKRIEKANTYHKKDTSYIKLLNRISTLYQYKNIDSIHYYSKKAYNFSEEANYDNGKIMSLINLSNYSFYKGENTESIYLLNKSLQIARDNKNEKLTGTLLNQIGLRYFDIGNHSNALKSYLLSIEIGKRIKDSILISIAKENIAILYMTQEDYVEALEIYNEVIKINEQLGNERFTAETKCNISELYLKLKDYKNASLSIDTSIAFFEKNKSYEWLASSYKTKGDIYLHQENPNLALYWYDKSLNLHKNLNDEVYKAPLLNSIAKANCNLKKFEEAEKYALLSLVISQKLSLLDITTNSYEILYEINKENKVADVALYYHEKYKVYSDSVSRKENLNSLGNLKTKLEFEKQQKDTTIANDKALAKQNIYIYLSLLASIVLGFVIFFMRKQSRTRKGFNNILRLKTQVLEKREIELSTINNTKDKLFSIIGHDLRGPVNALASILHMLKEKEIDQEEFLNFIPKVSNDVDAISFTLNNLLSWGRTQMTGSISEPGNIPLKKLVENNIKLLDEMAHNKNISVNNTILDDTIIWADRNQMDVVIRNLLSNAIKFTRENGKIIFSSLDKNNFIEISVKDNGVGMDHEFKHNIFSETNNLTSTYGTANEKGTGLGLTLCKEMILKNGGQIWVESEINKGTTFYFTLPKKALSPNS